MMAPGTFSSKNRKVVALIFAVALAMRVPFRSLLAYHWDSAAFALAINHYDLRIGLPHCPGYFLYVMLGRLVNQVIREPHTSLVWMSILAGAALPALGFLLGASLFGRGCGAVAATVLMTSPLCWFHSEVALTTIVDSALVTGTMLLCWRVISRGGSTKQLVGMSVMFGLVAGLRQETGPVLIPAWLYAFRGFPRPRWKKAFVSIILAGLICLLWFVPMTQLSGGFWQYLRLLRLKTEMEAPLTPWRGGEESLFSNLCFIVASCWTGLMAGGLVAGTELSLWVLKEKWAAKRAFLAEHKEQLWLMAAWILPMVGLGLGAYTTMPGYTLCYFPAIAIMTGAAVARFASRFAKLWRGARAHDPQHYSPWMVIVLLTVALTNVSVFLLPDEWTGRLLVGLPVTAANIRNHDEQLARCFRIIRGQWDPANILICHYGEPFLWGFRQFQYHLPEYVNCLLTRDRALAPPLDQRLWYATGPRIEFSDRFDPLNRRFAILVVPPGQGVDRFAGVFDVTHAKMVSGSEAMLYVISMDRHLGKVQRIP